MTLSAHGRNHAHHFLSRLDRVSRPHVELALSIYRDDALLRFVLDHARLPERAERVAISLDHPTRGPFIIVTRSGRFVTCLGEGMDPGSRPVVPRSLLDALIARLTHQRERMEARQRFFGPTGETQSILRRLLEAGDELSREELAAVASIAPLLRGDLVGMAARAAEDLAATRFQILRDLRRTDRLHPLYRPVLREYWKQFWAVGHLSVLAAMDGPGLADEVPAIAGENAVPFSRLAVEQGIVAVALRGIWAASKVGKRLLPGYKHALASNGPWVQLLDPLLGLTALGLRHARLRAEVQKALSAATHMPGDDALATAKRDVFRTIGQLCTMAFDAPEVCQQHQRNIGAGILVLGTSHLPEGDPLRFTRPEDVPEALAMTAAAQSELEYLYEAKNSLHLFSMLPWLARAAPEDLYLPSALVRALHVPWTPERTLQLLRGHQAHAEEQAATQATIAASAGPARGAPCPCGSQKKYKRCCGDAARSLRKVA
jgi:SEC-C motif